jgi:hypothetical protein
MAPPMPRIMTIAGSDSGPARIANRLQSLFRLTLCDG